LGSAFSGGTNFGHYKLGIGTQEILSCFESFVLLRFSKTAKGTQNGVDQGKKIQIQKTSFSHIISNLLFLDELVSCGHHILSTRRTGRLCVQKKEMVLFDFRRGSEHQEFSESTLANTDKLQYST
jgi:hypothetical protein